MHARDATATSHNPRLQSYLDVMARDRAARAARIGQVAPDVAVDTWLIGSPTTLADLRGQVVLLEFWAPWCRPCLRMFAPLQALHDAHAADGLAIVALTHPYSPSDAAADVRAAERDLIRTTVAGRGLTFRVGVMPDDRANQAYGANGVPTSVVIDRDGIVRYADTATESELQQVVRQYLEPSR
jgi:thiol-disulfide isomerase/thioredoxin